MIYAKLRVVQVFFTYDIQTDSLLIICLPTGREIDYMNATDIKSCLV